jgi:hypothetical protein
MEHEINIFLIVISAHECRDKERPKVEKVAWAMHEVERRRMPKPKPESRFFYFVIPAQAEIQAFK